MGRDAFCLSVLTGVAALVCVPLVAPSNTTARAEQAAPQPPTSGFRAEFLKDVTYFERRYISLAEAIPAEKYTWSPGEGVRSVSQVFLHVAHRNFTQPALVGMPPPADLRTRSLGFTVGETHEGADVEAFVRELTGEGIVETSTKDKSKLLETLKESFAHFRQAILRVSDADADKPVKWIGESTYRGVFLFWNRHLGEHLGQLIAYARVNGIVPPWTAERQRREPGRP